MGLFIIPDTLLRIVETVIGNPKVITGIIMPVVKASLVIDGRKALFLVNINAKRITEVKTFPSTVAKAAPNPRCSRTR